MTLFGQKSLFQHFFAFFSTSDCFRSFLQLLPIILVQLEVARHFHRQEIHTRRSPNTKKLSSPPLHTDHHAQSCNSICQSLWLVLATVAMLPHIRICIPFIFRRLIVLEFSLRNDVSPISSATWHHPQGCFDLQRQSRPRCASGQRISTLALQASR